MCLRILAAFAVVRAALGKDGKAIAFTIDNGIVDGSGNFNGGHV